MLRKELQGKADLTEGSQATRRRAGRGDTLRQFGGAPSVTDSTAPTTAPATQEPRRLSPEELRRHGLPADWNEQMERAGKAMLRDGQTYGRRR